MENTTPLFNRLAETEQNKSLDKLTPEDRNTLLNLKKERREGLEAIEKDYVETKDQRIEDRKKEIADKPNVDRNGPSINGFADRTPPKTPAQIHAQAVREIEGEHGAEVEGFVKSGREKETSFLNEKLGINTPDAEPKDLNLTNDFNNTGHDF